MKHRNLGMDEFEQIAALRHLRGGGPLGAEFMFRGRRGRARRGDVRAALLRLLAEEPRNGYQLMQAIEELSGGRWRPSPGSVYPALAQLEDQGLIRAGERDETKVFAITDAGREHLEAHRAPAAPWELEGEPDEPFESIRSLIGQTAQAAIQVARVGDEQQVKLASELLARARRDLYRILAEEPAGDGTSGS